MKKEEKILLGKVGRANHFTVPEGYFDSFADRMMEQLPEQDARIIEMRAEPWWHRSQVRKIAAAVGVAVMLGGGAAFVAQHGMGAHAPMASVETDHDNQAGTATYGSFDEMADYTMMDNQDFYASLVAEN